MCKTHRDGYTRPEIGTYLGPSSHSYGIMMRSSVSANSDPASRDRVCVSLGGVSQNMLDRRKIAAA